MVACFITCHQREDVILDYYDHIQGEIKFPRAVITYILNGVDEDGGEMPKITPGFLEKKRR